MEERFDRLERKLDEKFAQVEEKIGGLSSELRAVETRLRGHIEGVEAHLTGHIDRKIDPLSLKVGVLHEDVKADFRFSLEAQQGLKAQMEAGFTAQAQALTEALAPIKAAIRSAHAVPEQTT